ncbi:MAG: SDR family oxidoreductase [Dehalococcoidales bacterium]|nr:SDR family oxidoreductase [Dehalococcoidales bacterium]
MVSGEKKLEGKVALITGAGSGIGAATARRFVADGASVAICDINEEGLKQVAGTLPPDSVKTCTGDITELKDVERMVETALSFNGKLDILVNSAGIDPPEREPDMEKALDLWHKIIEVNLTGSFLTMKLAIPHMVKAKSGSVVNIASLSGIRYIGGRPSYTASKGGLIALTQMAAVEHGPANVRCNVICPGPVRTPLFESNTRPIAEMMGKDVEWVFEKFTSFSPMRRMGNPEEIAAICSFLASDDASLVTGNIMVADGGTSLIDANGAAMSTMFMRPPEKE